MNDPDVLRTILPVIRAFERLRISYYIGGSVASSAYGMARTTMDVDCVSDLSSDQVKDFVAMLQEEYYVDEAAMMDAIKNRSSFNLIHLDTMLKVDVFIAKSGSYDVGALKRRKKDTLTDEAGSPEIYLASPEDVILSKLLWYRQGGYVSERQWNDVVGVLKVQERDLDLEYLKHWADELRLTQWLGKALIEAGVEE